ncbi:hypothetical protein M407DRAFT_166398 [Tulasnella calospora MUT 4182]|uniref:Uncharacterized protein n=1 Tax=Tulasnella calospora MUT 4182 TaxID=1051891 RepID=A0A0C3LJ09_9AGAM|nr:hypothetical protein M407DRAFT_166398 [Tulasnella calospora MUT 4182]
MPPVDVLMVWHSYLLHPRTYLEDGFRYNVGLLYRGSFPLHEAAMMVESEDPFSPGTPAHERDRYWQSLTGQPWQPPTSLNDGGASTRTIPLRCPGCAVEVRALWIADDETGWAQSNFRTLCTSCGMSITKEAMATLKFAEDLRKVVEEPKRKTLATMLLDEDTGKPGIAGAHFFNQNIIEGLYKASFIPNTMAYAAKELEWSSLKVATRCRSGFLTAAFVKRDNGVDEGGLKGVQRMMEAYTTPGPYSINLVKAVQRQMNFVDSMVSLGWIDHGRFESESDESGLTLKRAVAQYHAFLDVMAVNRDSFLVPTLSIDLAWHTHQLLCVEYREQMLSLLGTIVDHDDAVEQEVLAEAFDQTARLWSTRFSIPYTICGCPVPSSSKPTIGAVAKLFGRKGKTKEVIPEIQNHRPDLLSHRGDDVYETHPSEHSEVKVINSASALKMALAREKMANKRLQEDQDAVSSGAADGWQGLLVRIRNTSKDNHQLAFSDSEASPPCDHLDFKALAIGQCAMGLGTVGKCMGGNTTARTGVNRNDGYSNHIKNSKGVVTMGHWI